MRFVEPPENLIRDGARRIDVGPPRGVSDEHCDTAKATVEHVQGGPFDGIACFRVYAKLDEREIAMLHADAGVIELSFYSPMMPMHSLAVQPIAEPDSEA